MVEAILLFLVCTTPWVYGAVNPGFEYLLFTGVAAALWLWGLRILLDGQLSWQKCPVALCLAALFLLGAWQLVPLSAVQLRQLSPAASRLYAELLPSQQEVLPFGEQRSEASMPVGSTISLYPGATRHELVQLLAVFLVFVLVRNNLEPVSGLRRLSVVALLNGSLLALFGLIQFFTSPHNTLYWTFPSGGSVFGPFVCRNHFAFYTNMCIGLGVGLLLSRHSRPERRWRTDGSAGFLSNLVHDPVDLWISTGLGIMITAVACSLSRGGILALVGAVFVCVASARRRVGRFIRLGPILLAAGLAAGLVVWFGLDMVQARWATLWQGEALATRWPLWSRVVALVGDYPVFGTGLGTFPFVEQLTRTVPETVMFEHAENEYLEGLIEGGLLRLVLSLGAIALVFRLGYRAVVRHQGHPAAGLALGGLFAFAGVAIESLGDFGLHIPAVALLAAVLSALLCGLGNAEPQPDIESAPDYKPRTGAGEYTLRLWGLGPLAGAATAAALGLSLYREGWNEWQADRLTSAAFRWQMTREPAAHEQEIRCLRSAAQAAPTSAPVRAQLASAHLRSFGEFRAKQERDRGLGDGVTVVLGALASFASAPVYSGEAASSSSCLAGALCRARRLEEEMKDPTHDHLVPSLRHYLAARDLCPLFVEPQLVLSGSVKTLARADRAESYLTRARFLLPTDPEIWYLSGVQAAADGRAAEACADWRKSLELSELYLLPILDRSAKMAGPPEILSRVLPDKPEQLLAAASHLFPGAAGQAERRPFLEKALAVLEHKQGALTAEGYHRIASLKQSLGRPEEALAAYQAALAGQPQQVAWRFEFAQLLHEQGDLDESRRELLTVLDLDPGHGPARELWNKVDREIAEKR